MSPGRPPLLSLDEALARLVDGAARTASPQTEAVGTFDALGRVLAAEVRSLLDVPPADNTSMDGYAMRAADVPAAGHRAAGEPAHPGRRRRPAAGAGQRGAHLHRRPGAAGADAVVMQEQCEALPTRAWVSARQRRARSRASGCAAAART